MWRFIEQREAKIFTAGAAGELDQRTRRAEPEAFERNKPVLLAPDKKKTTEN